MMSSWWSAVETDRHLQTERSGGRPVLPSLTEHRLHLDRGTAGMDRMIVAPEDEQQRVAPELQQAATAVVGDPEHPSEDVVEDLGQLLGADPSPSGELLGQRGESRDVDVAEVPSISRHCSSVCKCHSADSRGT